VRFQRQPFFNACLADRCYKAVPKPWRECHDERNRFGTAEPEGTSIAGHREPLSVPFETAGKLRVWPQQVDELSGGPGLDGIRFIENRLWPHKIGIERIGDKWPAKEPS